MVCQVRIDLKQFSDTPVLQDLSLEIPTGAFIALVGPSGAGKSTLLNILSGLDRDFVGRLDWTGGSPGKVGYVFQEPRLMPWLGVRRNLELVLPDVAAARERVDELLARIGLAERADAYPRELSGGMQRRVALARGMAIQPDVLLLDEPFASLDEPTAEGLRQLLIGLWRELGMAVLLVTHNLREALALADRVIFLSPNPGRIVLCEDLHPWLEPGAEPRDPDALLQDLLSRHPEILSGIASTEGA
ncbi:MAG: ABC transporter ATP-binding protein [Chromatiaceae bacterium]|nr:ABC transporter ATP-binding protein [Chromatiaceae bacterium]